MRSADHAHEPKTKRPVAQMSALQDQLNHFRSTALSEREKGTYFEELIVCYLRNEASYRDLYSQVWTYADWAAEQGLDKRDTGIDLVAKTSGTGEFHAIQCKLYATDYRDVDGVKLPHQWIVTWTNGQSTWRVSDIWPDVEIPAARFAKPAPAVLAPAKSVAR